VFSNNKTDHHNIKTGISYITNGNKDEPNIVLNSEIVEDITTRN
jgi:hypothetical protein